MSMEHSTTVMPVAERHRFDVDALERYLQRHVEGYTGPLEVEQFSRGQSNPTYRLTAGSRRYVLRRKPPGKLLPSAHAVDREYRVMTALLDTGVPVPRTYASARTTASSAPRSSSWSTSRAASFGTLGSPTLSLKSDPKSIARWLAS